MAGVGTVAGVAGCIGAPRGDREVPQEPEPRVDTPPHEIERPDPGAGDGDWNDHYLCEHIDAHPTVPFEAAYATAPAYEGGLSYDTRGGTEEYFVDLVTDRTTYDRVGPELRDELDAPDFDEQAVLVVQSGWGSSSVRPEIVRIESVDGDVRAHGCHVDPFVKTDDVTARTLLVTFDLPDGGVDDAEVALTVSPDRRVHVVAGEGVVSL